MQREDLAPDAANVDDTSRRAAGRWMQVVRIAVWCAGGVVAWLLLLNFAIAPLVPQLEPSWMAAITQAAATELQFGRDIIYTYGPLGYLAFSTYAEPLFAQTLVGRSFITAFYVAVVCLLASRSSWVRAVPFLLAAFCCAVLSYQAMYLFAALGVGWLLCTHRPSARWLLPIGLLFLATIALVKLTFLFFAVLVLAAGAAAAGYERRWMKAAGPAAAFLFLFAGLWLLAGQHFASVIDFLRTGIHVTAGYSRTMNVPSAPDILIAGITTALLVVLQVGTLAWRNRRDAAGVALSFLHCAALFLAWKLGFSRADAHTAEFFYFAIVATAAAPLLFPISLGRVATFAHLLVFLFVSCLGVWAIDNQVPGIRSSFISTLQQRWSSNPAALLDSAAARAAYAKVDEEHEDIYSLPKIKELVGQAPVTVFGFEQAIALANRLNFVPIPTAQTYTEYTPALAERNAAFFSSGKAPDYVIFKLQTIDNRLRTLDGADSLITLAYGYEPVLSEGGYLLLKRKAASVIPDPQQLPAAERGETTLGKPITVPAGAVWCELHLRQTLLGRFLAFFYQPPEIHVEMVTSTGEKIRRRILPTLAPRGFLINPLIESEEDFVRFATGQLETMKSVSTVRVVNERRFRQLMHRKVGFVFRALPAPPLVSGIAAGVVKDLAGYTDVFSRPAELVRSAIPVERFVVDGKHFLLVHPVGEVRFAVDPGASKVTGQYAIRADAYLGTTGVQFEVIYQPRDGAPVQLHQRLLSPKTAPADRGIQRFEAQLPADANGQVVLRTLPGPSGKIDWGWAGWGEIHFQ